MLNKQYTKLSWIPILLVAVAGLWSYNRYRLNPINYIGVTTFYIGSADASIGTDLKVYQYDQYYKLVSASSFADTLISQLTSPNTVSQIFQKSNIPLPSTNPDQIAKVIKSQKVSANSSAVIATITSENKTKTEKLTGNIVEVVTDNLDNFKKAKVVPQEIIISPSQSIFLEDRNNFLVAVGAPTIAGLIFGLALMYVIVNARSESNQRS